MKRALAVLLAALSAGAVASTGVAVGQAQEDPLAAAAAARQAEAAPARLLTGERVDGLGDLIVAIGSGLTDHPITKLFVEMSDGRSFTAQLGAGGMTTYLRSAKGIPVHGQLDSTGMLVLDPAFSYCKAPAKGQAAQQAAPGAAVVDSLVCQIGDQTHTGLTAEQAARRGRTLLSAGMAQHAESLRLPSVRRFSEAAGAHGRGLSVLPDASLSSDGGRSMMQVDASLATGTRSLLMVRVIFQGEGALSNPWGDAAFAKVAADVGGLAETASYGLVETVVTAVPCNLTIPLVYSTNPSLFSETIIRTKTAQALAAATDPGCRFTTSAFNHTAIFMRNDAMFGYAGLGSIPGSSIWITGPKYSDAPGADSTVLSHEYYHNLGVNHASTREVATGKSIEYGHMIDLMGSRTLARDPAATTLGVWWKAGLGWVPEARTLTLPFDAMRSAGVAPQGLQPAAPLDVSNSWATAMIPTGGLETDPFSAGKAAYPVVEADLAAVERDATTSAQASSTAVDTIRIPDPTGLRETWTYIGFRRENRLVDPAGGAEVASMGYGWAHPGDSVYPSSVFPALGLSTMVDPIPATESQTDAVIAPGQSLVIAHPFAHVTGAAAAGVSNASLVAQVLSRGFNPSTASSANDAALKVRVTRLDDRGMPPAGRGCAADGSCQPAPGGQTLSCNAAVSGTLTPGAPAAVYKLTSSVATGSASQTATITTCTGSSAAWSSSSASTTLAPAIAVFRGTFPSAQAYFGADIALGATDFSNVTLTDGSSATTFTAKRCGTLTIPVNGVEPWYIVVAPSSSATPSYSGSFSPLAYTLTTTCGATQACVRNAVSLTVTGPSYAYIYSGVYRLNPVTPIINSRPSFVRHDISRGSASRYDLNAQSDGTWMLYSYTAGSSDMTGRFRSTVPSGSIFGGVSGTNPVSFAIAVNCACPEALYNSNAGTGASVTCGACGGLSSAAPGSAAGGCRCLPGAGFVSSSGSCAICPPGSVKAGLSNATCTACPSGATSPGGAASIAACRSTRNCDAVAVSVKYTDDGTVASWISGTYYRLGAADYLVNGYPVYQYTPADTNNRALYLAFFVSPSATQGVASEGQWRFTTTLTAATYYATIKSWAPIQNVDVSTFDDAGNGVTLNSITCTCSGVTGGGSPNADGRCPGVVSAVAASLPKATPTPCPDGSTRSGCTACPTATPVPVALGDGTMLQPPGIRLSSVGTGSTQCLCPPQYVSGSQNNCVFPAYLTATFAAAHAAAGLSGQYNLTRVDTVTVAGSGSATVVVPVYQRVSQVGGNNVYLRYDPRPAGASLTALAFQGVTYSEWVFGTEDFAGSSTRFAYIPSLGEGLDAVLPVGALPRTRAFDPATRAFTAVELTIVAATPIDQDPFSPSPTPSITPSSSATASRMATVSVTRSSAATVSVTPSASRSATPTASTSGTRTASPAGTPTSSPTASVTRTRTASVTPSRSITPTMPAYVAGVSATPVVTFNATLLALNQYKVTQFSFNVGVAVPNTYQSGTSAEDTVLNAVNDTQAVYNTVSSLSTVLSVPRQHIRFLGARSGSLAATPGTGGFARRQLQTTTVTVAIQVSVLTTPDYPEAQVLPRINSFIAAPATGVAPLTTSIVNRVNAAATNGVSITAAAVSLSSNGAPVGTVIQPSPSPSPTPDTGSYIMFGSTKVEKTVVIAVAASVGGFLLVVISVGVYCCTCRKGRSCCSSAKLHDAPAAHPSSAAGGSGAGAKVSIHEEGIDHAAEHAAAATLVAGPSTRDLTTLTATAYVVPPPGSDRALVGIMDPALMPALAGGPTLAVTGVDALQKYPTRLSLSRSMTAAQMQQAQLAQMQQMQAQQAQVAAMQAQQAQVAAMQQMQAMQAMGYAAYPVAGGYAMYPGGGAAPMAATTYAMPAAPAAQGYGSPYGTAPAAPAAPPAGATGLDIPSFRRSQSLSRAGFSMSNANISPAAGGNRNSVGAPSGSPVPSYISAAAPYMRR